MLQHVVQEALGLLLMPVVQEQETDVLLKRVHRFRADSEDRGLWWIPAKCKQPACLHGWGVGGSHVRILLTPRI